MIRLRRAKNILVVSRIHYPCQRRRNIVRRLSLVKIYGSFHTNYNGFRSVFRYRSGNRSVLNSVTIDYVTFFSLKKSFLAFITFRKWFAKSSCVYIQHLYWIRFNYPCFSISLGVICEIYFLWRIKMIRRVFLMSNIKFSNRPDLNKIS